MKRVIASTSLPASTGCSAAPAAAADIKVISAGAVRSVIAA